MCAMWNSIVVDSVVFFLCKQKTAYERRSSDGSSDVCSSDLLKVVSPSCLRSVRSILCEVSLPRSGLPISYVLVARCTPSAYSSCADGRRCERDSDKATEYWGAKSQKIGRAHV